MHPMLRRLVDSPGLAAALTALALCACRSAAADVSAPDAVPAPEAAAAPDGEEPVSTTGFAGVWRTSYGVMRLKGGGPRVEGTYTWSGISHIAGDVDGRVLRATYLEPDGTQGRAVFELAEDGQSFNGRWVADLDRELELDTSDAGRWSGERAEPVAGRTWLVILEAHWEGSLEDHEYSYGDMLRAFFERVPEVEVRHRFFHDQADLVRFCGELTGLVEPVVLYISSHGTEAGLSSAAGPIEGAALGAALRDLEGLKLLHLGACELMGGDFAPAVRAAAGADFPISGFTVSVDWAGSALVDFAYLHLVLERGLEPAAAVSAARSMLTFAGEADQASGPIAGCDLSVLAPEE